MALVGDLSPRCSSPTDRAVERRRPAAGVKAQARRLRGAAAELTARDLQCAHRPGQTLGQIVRSLDGICIQVSSSSAKWSGNGGSVCQDGGDGKSGLRAVGGGDSVSISAFSPLREPNGRAAILASPLMELTGFCLAVDCFGAGLRWWAEVRSPISPTSMATGRGWARCYAGCDARAAVAAMWARRGW